MTTVLFWLDGKHRVLNIKEAKDGWEEGDEFATIDDLPEEQDYGDD